MTTLLSILAAGMSAVLLAWLGWRDPKRLRAQARRADAGRASVRASGRDARTEALTTAVRRGLTAAALAPGVILLLLGAWHPFLIWLGALCTTGWGVVQVLSRAR